MKKIKALFDLWKTWRLLRNNAGLFKVVEDVFKFAEMAHKEQRPVVCKIALINMGNGTTLGDFVSLWAGIGEASPIERTRHLKAQNIELKRLLQIWADGEVNDVEMEQTKLALELFS